MLRMLTASADAQVAHHSWQQLMQQGLRRQSRKWGSWFAAASCCGVPSYWQPAAGVHDLA